MKTVSVENEMLGQNCHKEVTGSGRPEVGF